MKKQLIGGKIAIIYHPGYGSGWYTWHGIREALFDPEIVNAIREDRFEEGQKYLEETYNLDPKVYNIKELDIYTVMPGSKFLVLEYDGSETIISSDHIQFIEA
jgi:hypothetical protein